MIPSKINESTDGYVQLKMKITSKNRILYLAKIRALVSLTNHFVQHGPSTEVQDAGSFSFPLKKIGIPCLPLLKSNEPLKLILLKANPPNIVHSSCEKEESLMRKKVPCWIFSLIVFLKMQLKLFLPLQCKLKAI